MSGYEIDFGVSGVRAGVVADAAKVADRVVLPQQTHSCKVAVIGRDGVVPPLADTDAVISMCSGVAVGVRTADCVPVLLYAPDIPAVAAVHAGWRGSLGGIVSNAVGQLIHLGADPARMKAAFGPCICGDCYEVSPELADDFRRAGFADCIIGTRNLDLVAVNRTRLRAAGLLTDNIITSSCLCTRETPDLPSWRRAPTDRRLATWICLSAANNK